MSTQKRLKLDSELHKRILKAEEMLAALGLTITYGPSDSGIIIEDNATNVRFCTTSADREYQFPRQCECSFILMED